MKMVSQRQGAAMKGFQPVLFLILPRNTGEGDGDEFDSPGEGDGHRGRLSQGKKCGSKQRSAGKIPFPPSTAAAVSRRWFAAAWRQSGMREPNIKDREGTRKTFKEKAARERDLRTPKENSQGVVPEYLPALGARWQEAGEVYPAGGSLKQGAKGGGDNRYSGEMA